VGCGEGGGSKIEEITYIIPFLAFGVVESASLAVAALLGVVPVVPRGRMVGTRGQRGGGGLLSVCLVFGVQSGRAQPHSTTDALTRGANNNEVPFKMLRQSETT